jgi:DNA primase
MTFRIDVPKLCKALGLDARKRGALWFAKCPAHADSDPSWRIVDDPRSDRHGSHHCFSCGWGGGPWELVSHVLDISLEEAGRWVMAEMLDRRVADDDDVPRVVIREMQKPVTEMVLPSGVLIPSLDGSEWFTPALEYLEFRGVPQWQRERWHIGYALHGSCNMRIVVPVVTGGKLISYVARAFVDDGRARYDVARRWEAGARSDVALFGEPGFVDRDTATVTEGVFKALAMERAGAPNPCAILGASNLGDEKIANLAKFRRILIATDPDRAGEQCADLLRTTLGRWCDLVRVPLEIAPDDATVEQNETAWRAVA